MTKKKKKILLTVIKRNVSLLILMSFIMNLAGRGERSSFANKKFNKKKGGD